MRQLEPPLTPGKRMAQGQPFIEIVHLAKVIDHCAHVGNSRQPGPDMERFVRSRRRLASSGRIQKKGINACQIPVGFQRAP